MASTRDWFPQKIADQADMFDNIDAKIDGYQAVLALTAGQVADIHRICETFTQAYTFVEQCRASTFSLGEWRDILYKGTPQGTPAPDAPVYPAAPPNVKNWKIGILQEFRDLRDIILASPGYTDAIGEDLMIVGNASGGGPSQPVGSQAPDLKLKTGSGYEISLAGPMHGMDAMRVEWQKNGAANWSLVGFLTKTPGTVNISPTTPGDPESGRIRARYIHNNEPVGDYSPEYAVTVSQ